MQLTLKRPDLAALKQFSLELGVSKLMGVPNPFS
jgi:hypothetical protein